MRDKGTRTAVLGILQKLSGVAALEWGRKHMLPERLSHMLLLKA